MWRTERKTSRLTLGEALGLTDHQIQKYEKATNRIGASRLQQICTVLEIPVALLFEGPLGSSVSESGMPQDMIDFLESPEGVRFVAAFSRITDRKMRRGIARLTSRIVEGMQPKALTDLLQLKEPADNT
jgi:transcriptional regulator with XRE-family HTH domain